MSTFIGIPRMPTTRQVASTPLQQSVTWMACSLLLDYPDGETAEQIDAVRAELGSLPDEVAGHLADFCDSAEGLGLRRLQEHYVETFDQRRRCALYLTYYSHGDTRDRGNAILTFRHVMASCGFESARDELPDYLPVVLEFCALDEQGVGRDLLTANRQGLEVLRSALLSANSPYAGLLQALTLTLPQPDEAVIEGYRRLVAQGPPTELVGVGDLTATPFPVSER
ncbi:MAG: nitrate reductase molybdenum cofactor assembly chaperone [Actinomycetaceae bacterium]|nr:nitrate reductase molybdenum cofactor assembly chaperone [Actinomycetaceae bacterium]